jgi:hypothetical protein
VRALEAIRKQVATEDPLLGMLPTEDQMKEDDAVMAYRGELQKQRDTEAARTKEQQRRDALQQEREFERMQQDQDRELYAAAQQVDAERSRVAIDTLSQTQAGRLQLLRDGLAREQALFSDDATMKVNIAKKYAKAEREIYLARKDMALSVTSTMFGALAGAASQFFGEQSAAAKAFGVLEVMVNTQRAVMQAWAAYPPPYGSIMAAAAYIQGATSIARILGAGKGAGGVGSGSSAPSSPSTQGSVPETPTATTPAETEQHRERGRTTIIIQNMIGERSWVANNLIPLLEEAEGNRGWNAEVRS